MAKRGLKPNHARWREAAKLRCQGLTLAEVGKAMGITKQAVAYLLSRSHHERGDRCRSCKAPLTTKPLNLRYTTATYCLACLARHREAPLGQRIRAYRVAAGLHA